ncbi:hypothetical protein AVEN_43395-1 [Araneus ventricosus]|uniref:Uncharacterized protein n=1 Tax=Araneus ventricosus TaxID=182803 RepID=A0A4Y2RSP6_ARAVE|nr:hypothetical protein AVEN_43395-1 [Araneus ventricosus]
MRTSAGLSYSRIEITKDSRTKCLGRVHESRDEVLASHCNPPRAVYSYRKSMISGPSAASLRYGGIAAVGREPHICVWLLEQNVFYQMALLFHVSFKRLVPYISISLSEVRL